MLNTEYQKNTEPMITEKIELMERQYRIDNQGEPKILLIHPDLMPDLMEDLELGPMDILDDYMGMQVIVDESSELELHSYASFQAREY